MTSPDMNQLLPLIYDELRRAAGRAMAGERPGHTLQPTALVHEALVKISAGREKAWANEGHLYKAAAEAMRQVLLDHAKARGRVKRGGDRRRVPLGLADLAEHWPLDDIVSLDEALRRLSERDEGIADVVRLRLFAGLTVEQCAAALGVSPATVKRRWEFGRVWIHREVDGGRHEPDA